MHPYKWYAATQAPPGANVPPGSLPPGAAFSQNGVLTGPATWNFMPNAYYPFGVVMVDAIGQMNVKLVVIDTRDIVAQIAACFLLGLCM